MILLVKFLLAIPFLLYASYSDLRWWRVLNNVWVAILATLLPLTVLQYILLPVNVIVSLLVLVVWFAALNILYRFGWGGADVKALMVIVICFPWSLLIMWVAPFLMLYSLVVVIVGYSLGMKKYPFIPVIAISYVCGGVYLWTSSLS